MAYRVNYFSKTKSKNKYNAKKQEYGGVKYDSKFEAKYAEDLDWQLQAGELIEVKRQVKIPLKVNGVLITNYYCDFRVVDKHGQVKYIEVKGFETEVYRIKKKLFVATLNEIDPGAEYIIVK